MACNPFVTGSLLFVAPVRHQAAASSCGVVLCSSLSQPVSRMATGSGRPAGRGPPEPGCPDPSITQRVGVTVRSPELYDLDSERVPDVLGLHA